MRKFFMVLLVLLTATFVVGAAVIAPAADAPQCSDGIDNDDDKAVDFPDDRDCTSADDTTESGTNEPQCSDGIDNDKDGDTDFPDDENCSDDDDNNEHLAECEDGVD